MVTMLKVSYLDINCVTNILFITDLAWTVLPKKLMAFVARGFFFCANTNYIPHFDVY